MKVKLKIDMVLNGSVWPAGSVVEVTEAEAKQLVDAQEAETVSTATARKDKEEK